MAKRDPKVEGKTFAEKVLAKIPEDKRTAVQEALLADAVLEELGNGALRQDEFSRLADGLRETEKKVLGYKGTLDTWYAEKQADLAEAAKLRAKVEELEADGGTTKAVDLSGYVKTEDVDKLIKETQEQGLSLMTVMTRLGLKHMHQFKEVLDPEEVIKHAREKNLRLDLAYDDFIRPRVEEQQKKDIDARIEKAKQEGALEERQRNQATPYPVSNSEPTTLAGLDPKFDKTQSGVQAAVDDYYKSQRPV